VLCLRSAQACALSTASGRLFNLAVRCHSATLLADISLIGCALMRNGGLVTGTERWKQGQRRVFATS
jgi:hypothetical protein